MYYCLSPQEALWSALKAGQIDMVVSDHSPCTPDLKKLDTGDFIEAWGGISSLQFGNQSSVTSQKLNCDPSTATILPQRVS